MQAALLLIIIPLAALNFLSGAIAFLWLLTIGEWRPTLVGILIASFSPLTLSLATLPGVFLFGLPVSALMIRNYRAAAAIFVFLSHIYTHALIGIWVAGVFAFFMHKANPTSFWPLLLWSYSVSMAPWSYLAQKETKSDGGAGEGITLFFAQVAILIALALWLIFKQPTSEIVFVFSGILLASSLLQSLMLLGSRQPNSLADIKSHAATLAPTKAIGTRNTTEQTAEQTVIEMIQLRRKLDPDARRLPHPSRIPVFQLWQSPEFIIYTTISRCHLLTARNIPESLAISKIDSVIGLNIVDPEGAPIDLNTYIKKLLGVLAPDFLMLGPQLLSSSIAIATKHVIQRSRKGEGYPPNAWLSDILTPSDLERELGHAINRRRLLTPQSRVDMQLAEFLILWQPGDQLYRFSSPPETWRMMMGRAGIALVHDGKSISYIETMMN